MNKMNKTDFFEFNSNEEKRKAKLSVFNKITLMVALISLVTVLGTNLTAADDMSDLDLTVIKTEPLLLQTGEYADVWIKMTNKGNKKSENTTLEFVPQFPFSVDPDEELKKNFGQILPGQVYQDHFQVRVDENAVQGENDLKFRYTFGQDSYITREVPVQVRSDDAALVVESVTTNPDKLTPTKTGEVSFKIRNLADSYLKNIDVSLGLDSDQIPMVPVGSTTRKRVQKLKPGESTEVSYKVKVDSDADAKAYKVPISVEYENQVGNKFSFQELTGIVVGGEPALEVNLVESNILKSGSSGEVSLSIVNRGLTQAKFLNVELKTDKSFSVLSRPKVYVGNMESDDYESASFDIYVKEGTKVVSLPVKLSYKDSEGTSRTFEDEISFRTYNSTEIDQMDLVKQDNTFIVIIGVVVLLVVAYAAYKYWGSRKKRILEE